MPITAKELTYTYAPGSPFETTALDNIDLTVDDGEYLGIIGNTGSGKTTFIKLLAGLMRPTSGAVLLDGEDIFARGYDKKKLRARIGVVFQYPEYQLFEETVYRDIAYGPTKQGLSEDEVRARVADAAGLMDIDLAEVGEKSPFDLSGGQKRRVAIAGVLAMSPGILILDEPVAGLDPVGRAQLFDFVGRLNDAGTTIILITHSMDDLATHARRVIAFRHGKLAMDGTPQQIFARGDEIEQMGLSSPVAAVVAAKLRERGIDVPQDVITPEALVRFVRGAL